MLIYKKIIRMLSLLGLASVVVGCASYSGTRLPTYESDISGKVLRSIVEIDESDSFGQTPGLLFRSTWNSPAKKYRWVTTKTKTGAYHYSGYHMTSFSVVSDSVPPDLKEDDIVDVLELVKEYDHNYDIGQAEKVLRLVCRGTDKKCIKEIKASNQWGALYGYEIHMTPEELASYKVTPRK